MFKYFLRPLKSSEIVGTLPIFPDAKDGSISVALKGRNKQVKTEGKDTSGYGIDTSKKNALCCEEATSPSQKVCKHTANADLGVML